MHAARAILNGGEIDVKFARHLTCDFGSHRASRVNIDIRERFNERLRMPKRDAAVVLHNLRKVVVTALVNLLRSVGEPDIEIIRVFLMPVQGGIGAVDADAQVILFTDRNLRGEKHTANAAFIMHEEIAIVF